MNTYPFSFDHVLHLLHGGVDIVTGEVEQDAKRRDLAAPAHPRVSVSYPRTPQAHSLPRLELSEALCHQQAREFSLAGPHKERTVSRKISVLTSDRNADAAAVLVKDGDVHVRGEVPPVELRHEVGIHVVRVRVDIQFVAACGSGTEAEVCQRRTHLPIAMMSYGSCIMNLFDWKWGLERQMIQGSVDLRRAHPLRPPGIRPKVQCLLTAALNTRSDNISRGIPPRTVMEVSRVDQQEVDVFFL